MPQYMTKDKSEQVALNNTDWVELQQATSPYTVKKFSILTLLARAWTYISSLPTKSTPDGTDLVGIYESGGTNKAISITDLATYFGSTVSLAYRRQKTFNTKFGFWGEVIWGSTTTVIVKPKSINGMSWIGVILNDGKYLEDITSTSITLTLDTTTLDGVGAIQISSWYSIIGYEDAGGALAFDFQYMPVATLSSGSPTTTLSLNQINSKDIKSLFPVGSNLCLWESGTKFETPIYGTTGGYVATKTNMTVASYPGANQIALTATLAVTNFAVTTTKVYAVDGFAPYDCTTGAIHANIGARGWIDMGIRIYTTAAGAVKNFFIGDDKFYFSNGTGAADYADANCLGYIILTSGYVNYLIDTCPADKSFIGGTSAASTGYDFTKLYYDSYGRTASYTYGDSILEKSAKDVLHRIYCAKYSGSARYDFTIGYFI